MGHEASKVRFFLIFHRIEKRHQGADCLSRNPVGDARAVSVLTLHGLLAEQSAKVEASSIIDNLRSAENDLSPLNRQILRNLQAHFQLRDGILYRRSRRSDSWLYVVPKALCRGIIVMCHDALTAGHLRQH